MTRTPLRWIRRTALLGYRLIGAVLVSGLVVLTSAQLAEASPFVLHVTHSSGGGGGTGGGGTGTPGGGMWGTPGGLQGLTSPAGTGVTSSSKSQVETDTASLTAPGDAGALSGVPIGSVDPAPHIPNTSPFGSSSGSMAQMTLTAATGGLQARYAGVAGATPGSVARLDLGNGEGLSVSKAIADSLSSIVQCGNSTFCSNTDGVLNAVGPASSGDGATSSVNQNQVTIPNLNAGLITYSGSLVMPNSLQSASNDLAPTPNPEPATFLLLGTGMILAARRYVGRPKK